MKKIDTFSANSLKILDKNIDEFKKRYINNLYLNKKDEKAVIGQIFHSLICQYLKKYDVSKMSLELNEKEKKIWQNIEKYLEDKKDDFIKTEYSFLVKNEIDDDFYYLTGRFDAVYLKNDEYIIYDWKTSSIPKDANSDLQTIVYLYCANIIFKTDKIKLKYLSLKDLKSYEVSFKESEKYKKRIDEIIKKL